MRGVYVLGVVTAGVARASRYPDCAEDNCYRNLIDDQNRAAAPGLCAEFLVKATNDTADIPARFGNCDAVQAVSLACSCVTYTARHRPTGPASSAAPS